MNRLLLFFSLVTSYLLLTSCQPAETAQQPSTSPAPWPSPQLPSKFGFIDRTGQRVIQPEFEDADSFSEGLAFVKQGKRVGYIDRKGKFVLRSKYDAAFPFSDGLTPVSLPQRRQGFVDKTGAVLVRLLPEVYAGPFWKGLAIARNQRYKFGLIDKAGNFVISPQFNSPQGDMDVYNKPTFPDGLELMNLNGTLADKETNWAGSITDGTWVYINRNGKFVIQKQALFARQFSEGLAAIDAGKWNSETMRSIDQWGFIDRTGQFVIPPKFADVGSFSEGLAAARLPSSDSVSQTLYGYINRQGEFIIPPQFVRTTAFSEGLAAVDIGGKSGYINKSGKFIIPTQFDSAEPFSEGIAKVVVAEKFGYINKERDNISPNLNLALLPKNFQKVSQLSIYAEY
jgi:hypothetical protein